MNIWQKFLRALRSFPWWARRRSVACDPARSFSNEELADALGLRRVVLAGEPITDPTLEIPAKPERNVQLEMLDHRIANLRELIEKNKRQKKAWKKHEVTLKALFAERAKLSGTM